jgi:hypothetical protein
LAVRFRDQASWVISLRDGPWKLLADAQLKKFELYTPSR